MSKEKVTLQDIADMAGVTIGTVDRAMHNRSGISEETRRRILEIANRYNYKPDMIGRSLSLKGKKLKIGVLIREYPSFFWDSVLKGILAAAKESALFGVEILLKRYDLTDYEDQDSYMKKYKNRLFELKDENVDAMVIVPINNVNIVKDIDDLSDGGIPVVTVNDDNAQSKRIFHIGPDTYQSGRVAAQLTGDLLQGKGNVLLYTANYLSYGYFFRKNGFINKMSEDYPCINVIERKNTSIEEAFYGNDIVLRDYDCICNVDGATVSSVVDLIIRRNDAGRFKYVGFEINNDVKKYLQSGEIHAIVSQDAYSQGYFALKMLTDFLLYKKMPKYNCMYVRTDIILKENMIINDRIINPYFMDS